jgi:predicted glycoside hydrolase/deacetylase ChbG (UPF0249 family)
VKARPDTIALVERARVVVNADDFGLCAAVNRAIGRAHEEGVLTSASLLANGPVFDEAVAIARARPSLGVGVHLNLLRGRPLARVPSLVGEDGLFLRSPRALFARALAGRIARADIEAEVEAQIARVRAAGLAPTHLDGEKHAHHWLPGFFDVAIEAARRHSISTVRVVRTRVAPGDVIAAPRAAAFATFLSTVGWRLAGRARRAGVRVADEVVGVARTGRLRADDIRAAFGRAGALVEVMTHPGEPRPGDPPIPEEMGRLKICGGWEGELRALLEAAPGADRSLLGTFAS